MSLPRGVPYLSRAFCLRSEDFRLRQSKSRILDFFRERAVTSITRASIMKCGPKWINHGFRRARKNATMAACQPLSC